MGFVDTRHAPPLSFHPFGAPVRVTSSFEEWCDEQGIHPEKFGAWETYQLSTGCPSASTDAVIGGQVPGADAGALVAG